MAFAVTEIQIAHYYISEPFLVCFMVGAVYFSVVLMQRPSWWAAAGAGACLGFAVASKVTIAFFGLIIIAAIVLRAAYRLRSRKLGADLDDPVGMRPATVAERERTFGKHLLGGLRYFLVAAIFTLLAFSISEPYALWQFDFTPLQQSAAGVSLGDNVKAVLDFNPWTRRIEGEAAIQSGEADIPYTRQYIGTVPVLYHAEQLVFWGMGVIPGLVGLAGVLLAIWLAFRRRPAEILLLAGAIPYFLTIAGLRIEVDALHAAPCADRSDIRCGPPDAWHCMGTRALCGATVGPPFWVALPSAQLLHDSHGACHRVRLPVVGRIF